MSGVRAIADAVLYEGYLLWPYRRSAVKNQRRWTFGGVYPPAWSRLHPDDPAELRTEVLLDHGDDVEVTVRFLQVVERTPVAADGRRVDELAVDGERYLAWDEAVEREICAGPGRTPIEVPAGSEDERLGGGASLLRTWAGIEGAVEVTLAPPRVSVRIVNETPWSGRDREQALRQTFCSTHAVLHAPGGAFLSAAESGCEQHGLWPVLVGDERDRDTMLAAPIILSDHPQIAPESPGDLFDSTEIDKLLILNVLSLTPEEQAEVRASDPRAREILDRCAGLSPGELMQLHGVFRA